MQTKTQEQVQRFVNECQRYGFDWSTNGNSVVTISRRFAPNDKNAFTECDMFAGSVLMLAPLKGGSIWGTDGGSVGGWSGLQNGHFVLNKSGAGSRFLKALSKYKNDNK